MRRLVCLAAVILTLACRKRVEPRAEPVAKDAPKVAASSPWVSAIASASVSAVPEPVVTPPSVSCQTDARLRWAEHETDLGAVAEPTAGPPGLACSPLTHDQKDGVTTMYVAPGTILSFPVQIEVQSDGGWASVDDPTYVTAGLPKGAWVDPADRAFKWHVAGAEGQTFAFSVGVQTALPEGKRCIVAPIVVRVRDDASTREAQVRWMSRGGAAAALVRLGNVTTATPEWLDFDQRAKCGDAFDAPTMFDVDGDGKDDAIFETPSRGGGYPPYVSVWVRKGETFADIGQAPGVPAFTPDGAAFVVDEVDGATGVSCHPSIRLSRIFGNRIQEMPRWNADVIIDRDTAACDAIGITVDRDPDGKFLGFTAHNSPKSAVATRVYRWNGKTFAQTKSP